MKMFLTNLRLCLSFIIFGISLAASPVFAEGCAPIVSVPVTISESGTYCLTGDLVYSGYGYAIDVQADNVTVDFKGFELKGDIFHRMTGVATGAVKNVLVRDGKITNALTGVILGESSVVENMVIHDIKSGVSSISQNIVVRGNIISKVYTGYDAAGAAGISISGGCGSRIENNTIQDFINYHGGISSATAYGIVAGGCQSVIRNNFIHGNQGSGAGVTIGIYSPVTAASNLIIDNHFSGTMAKELSCVVGSIRFKDNISTSSYSTYDCDANGDLGGNL